MMRGHNRAYRRRYPGQHEVAGTFGRDHLPASTFCDDINALQPGYWNSSRRARPTSSR